ncbi:glycosyltransferase family 39 protein [Jatrophihabitans sp. GAS493]|uniref:ArnT family glycosyltransferase n=1 Tax=Jatrophihabitans sp. GAS493 TaxID=1907575 RepID=UPI0012FE16DA|nr:glycosyltransferase family 39 protein [Jatrophihabitans sp. GAS493]
MLGASIIWPMFYGFDEPQHLDMGYVYSQHPFTFFGPGELPLTSGSVGAQRLVDGFPPVKRFADVPVAPRSLRPSFDDLGGTAFVVGSQPNQMVQHPPLYYWGAAVVLRLPGVNNLAWDIQVWLVRCLSMLFMLPVPLLCWASTRRLLPLGTRSDSTALLAALVPLTVPNLVRDGSAVTNDSLLIAATSVLLYLLCRVLTGDLSRRTAVGVAVALCATLWTKGFALGFPPIVVAAYVFAATRRVMVVDPSSGAEGVEEPGSVDVDPAGGASRGSRLGLRAVLVPLLISLCGAVVGGLWWLRNLLEFGTVQINGLGPTFTRLIRGEPKNTGTLGGFWQPFVRGFVLRLWGGLGLLDKPALAGWLVYGWFFLVLLGVVVSLLRRRDVGDRLRSMILLAVPLLSFLIVFAGSFSEYHQYLVLAGVQGRYVYHGIVAVAALAAIGWASLVPERLIRWLARALAIAALLTNLLAWRVVLRTWYAHIARGASPSVLNGYHSLLRWSPLPSVITILLTFVFPVLAGAWMLVSLWRPTSGGRGDESSRRGRMVEDVTFR